MEEKEKDQTKWSWWYIGLMLFLGLQILIYWLITNHYSG